MDKIRQEFGEFLIETLKKQMFLGYIKRKKKQEFLGKLKYGKKHHRSDDPGPW